MVTASAVTLTALVAVLVRLARFEGCTGTTAFGWTVPPIAGLVIGAVAWLLLQTRSIGDERGVSSLSSACPSCGERVIRGWRLCPYCGKMLGAASEHVLPEDAA